MPQENNNMSCTSEDKEPVAEERELAIAGRFYDLGDMTVQAVLDSSISGYTNTCNICLMKTSTMHSIHCLALPQCFSDELGIHWKEIK